MNWQTIFLLSKVNGGYYDGDGLPPQNWEWPTNTWFQERLRDVREKQWAPGMKTGQCEAGESVENRFLEDMTLL